MSHLLQPVFAQLWHSDPSIRLQTSVQLVAHLEEAQKSAVASSSNATTNNEDAVKQLEDGLAPEVSYTLKRLIRGLASPRESSRIGFAVALTELLARIPDIVPHQVYPLLKSSSELASGSKGSEERDLLFARLFGIHAVVASGFLFRPSSSLYDWRVAIEEVLFLGERKAWLRESAGWVVQCATRQLLARNDVEWKTDALKVLVDAAFKTSTGSSVEWTPERLALAILLQHAGVDVNWASIVQPAFPQPLLLSSTENLPAIARILRGLSPDERSKKANEQAQSTFVGTTRLHFVWTEILDTFYGSPIATEPKSKNAKLTNGQATAENLVPFLEFYKIAIDNNLFTETASIPTKNVGLLAFKACLTTVDADVLPALFTPNVLRTLMNHLAKGDRTLHGVAVQIAKLIPEVAQKNKAAAFDILLRLFSPPIGNIRFDSLTRTRVVEGVVAALDLEGIKKYTSWLFAFIIEGDMPASSRKVEDDAEMADEDEELADAKAKALEYRRLWAVDQLVLLVRRHQKALPLETKDVQLSAPEYAWTTRILQFMLVHGFTKVMKTTKKSNIEALKYKPDEAFSPSFQQSLRSRFFAALSHVVTVNTKCRSEPWTRQCFDTLLALQQDTKHVTPLASQEAIETSVTASKMVARLQTMADKQKAQYLSFFLEVLTLLSLDPSSDAEDHLEQMQDAIEAIIVEQPAPSKATSSKQSEQAVDDSDEGEEAEPISVLIDLLVNLMQKSSVLLRTVSERVFAAASGDVSEQALQLLIDQIVPEVLEEEEDLNDDDSESENSDEADELEAKERRRSTGRDSDESSEDDEDDDEDGDLDLEVDEELRAKILEALKESGVNEGDDHDELNGEDDSFEEEEELLDDDQMMELDDKLAEIFKQRNSASKTAKQAAQASHDAQLKVIDLLEIYAKQQSANPLLLHIFLPLFNAARRSGKEDSDIASKAARALNGIVSKAKDYPVVKDPGYVLETLKSIHEGSARSGTEDVEGLAVSTSLYLCKVALASEESEIETAIVDIYLSSLNAYLIKKSCRLHGRFFESFINRYRETAWQLRESLIEACSENTKTSDKHRRATCFHLMSSLFNTHASLVSPPFRRLPKRFTNRVFQKSPEAKREVIDFMPRYVEVFFSTFEAASEGAGMGLQIARLREIIKACSEAVRATKTALKNGPSGNTWDIWRSTELSDVFARMTRSTKIEKAGSLNSAIRGLMDSINQGSGRAKVRSVKNGEPDMLPMDASGKAVTPLDQRQIKKAQSKKENKKRKRQEKEDVDVSAQAVAEEHVASTSEDSD